MQNVREANNLVPPASFSDLLLPKPSLLYHLSTPDYQRKPCFVSAMEIASRKIYADSNGFLVWAWEKDSGGFNGEPEVGKFLKIAYKLMLDDSTERIKVNQPAFLLSNAYTGWNIGHDLSTMLFAFRSYRQYCAQNPKTKPPVVVVNPARLALSKNTADLIELYVPKDMWLEVEQDKLYEFQQLIIPPSAYYSFYTPDGFMLFEEMRQKILLLDRNEELDSHHSYPEKVILCKREGHQFARKAGIMPEWVEKKLTSEGGWVILDPEKLHFFDIAIILNHAKSVILGSGAIFYAHRLLVNPSASVFVLFDAHIYSSPLDNLGKTVFLGIRDTDYFEASHWSRLFDMVLSPEPSDQTALL